MDGDQNTFPLLTFQNCKKKKKKEKKSKYLCKTWSSQE